MHMQLLGISFYAYGYDCVAGTCALPSLTYFRDRCCWRIRQPVLIGQK